MKIDVKYFVPFLLVVALAAALLIAFFTVNSQRGQRQTFREGILQQDSLKTEYMKYIDGRDSLRIQSFQDQYVILDFWATWSNFSEDAHKELAELVRDYPGRVQVIAAVVQDKKEKVSSYIEQHSFPFLFVEGTDIFNRYHIPGLPTQLVYDLSGEIMDIHFGYIDSTEYDRLRTRLNDEE